MSISAISGVGATQSMFDVSAQLARNASTSAADSNAGSSSGNGASSSAVGESVNVSVLRMALNSEQSLVNLLA